MDNSSIVIAFCGKARSGKDTAAAYLVEKYGFVRLAFADQLKKIAREQFDWDGKKDERGRRLLQTLGTDVGRAYDENLWVRKFFNSDEFGSHNKIVITDCRFPNEAAAVKNVGGFLVLLEGRGGLTGEAALHPSETSMDDWTDWDMVVNNSIGFTELYVQLDMLITSIASTENCEF